MIKLCLSQDRLAVHVKNLSSSLDGGSTSLDASWKLKTLCGAPLSW